MKDAVTVIVVHLDPAKSTGRVSSQWTEAQWKLMLSAKEQIDAMSRAELIALKSLEKAALRELRKAMEVKSDSAKSKTSRKVHDVFPIGSKLRKLHRGLVHEVVIVSGGFQWEGRQYRSLTRIAREMSGKPVSGNKFFHLTARTISAMSTNRETPGGKSSHRDQRLDQLSPLHQSAIRLHLLIGLATGRYASITHAADELGVSESWVSKAVVGASHPVSTLHPHA